MSSLTVTYIKQYYPSSGLEINNDFRYQELIRLSDAIDYYNSERKDEVLSGWNSIRNMLQSKDKLVISEVFLKFINEKLSNLDRKINHNVRGPVKEILMYPLIDFLKWSEINIKLSKKICNKGNKILKDIKPQLEIVEGRIYLMLNGFTKKLCETFPANMFQFISKGLIENPESDHITVVGSKDVPKDTKEVKDLIDNFNQEIILKCNRVKHNISLDWPLFSVFVAVIFNHDALKNFIESYDKKFKTKLKVSLHRTIYVLLR
jgi:hypothetical protein